MEQKKIKRNYNQKYIERLKTISHIAAIYHNNNSIVFTPSFEIKDNVYTESSRKYIGILSISKVKYLIYYISKEHTQKYINSIFYDIQKEGTYKNIIVLVDDINRIELKNFVFGLKSVIICQYTDNNLEKLKYLHQVNWNKALYKEYKNSVHISEYNFCDYTDSKNKYISLFFYLDTEKMNRIDNFLNNNPSKSIDIFCEKEISSFLRQRISEC